MGCLSPFLIRIAITLFHGTANTIIWTLSSAPTPWRPKQINDRYSGPASMIRHALYHDGPCCCYAEHSHHQPSIGYSSMPNHHEPSLPLLMNIIYCCHHHQYTAIDFGSNKLIISGNRLSIHYGHKYLNLTPSNNRPWHNVLNKLTTQCKYLCTTLLKLFLFLIIYPFPKPI